MMVKAFGLAANVVLIPLGFGAASTAVSIATTGADLLNMARAAGAKYGLDGKDLVDGVRIDAFLDLDEAGRLAVEEANAELARVLQYCLPDRDAVVAALEHPDGFPTRATALVMQQLALQSPALFGEEGRARDAEYARSIVETALTTALANKDYFQKLLPDITVAQSRTLGLLAGSLSSLHDKTDRVLQGQEELKSLVRAGLKAGLSEAQVSSLLASFGHEGVSLDQAEPLLLKAAEELKALRLQLVRLTNADPVVARLKADAAQAIDEARLDEAKALLIQAADLDRGIAGELKDALQAHALSAAESLIEAARVAGAQARLIEAADFYREAADLAEPFDAAAAFSARWGEGDACYDHALLFGGLGPIRRSVTVWQALETQALNDERHAAVQVFLGNALGTLGERTGGAEGLAALNQAVEAYRAALTVRTETDMPAQWAMTQNNLGAALQTLGARTGGAEGLAALDQAVEAYHAALTVRTETDMPAQWATTQNNLGNALQTLGERAGGAEGLAALNQAVEAYRAALTVRTETDMPAQWAMTQNNLGTALQTLGERAGGAEGLAALNQAVEAYRTALTVYTETDMPADWAMTSENLALAWESLSEIDGGAARLDDTIALMDRVIAVFEAMQAGFYIEKAKRDRDRVIALRDRLRGGG